MHNCQTWIHVCARLRWPAKFLGANGYVAVGLDHYAKPADTMARALAEGSLARNFQGYTTDGAAALIGLGASAIGALPQGYVQNASAVPLYRASVMKSVCPSRAALCSRRKTACADTSSNG